MVEVALIVPAIMFLFLAGVTLAHVVQLSRTADRVAAVLADDFSQRTTIAESDFDEALTATTELIDIGDYNVASWLSVQAIALYPATGANFLWRRNRDGGGGDCTASAPSYATPVGTQGGAGVVYLIQVDLCATPGDGFFLSSALSVMEFSIHARAVAPVRQAAARSLE